MRFWGLGFRDWGEGVQSLGLTVQPLMMIALCGVDVRRFELI